MKSQILKNWTEEFFYDFGDVSKTRGSFEVFLHLYVSVHLLHTLIHTAIIIENEDLFQTL